MSVEELGADLDAHRIEGFIPAGGHINIPLISHIEGNLWTGGCINGVLLPDSFKYVVSLYMWEKYRLPEGCSRIEVEMYDAREVPDDGLLEGLGSLVAHLMDSGQTLVHCQAGINRSNLISTLALRQRGRTSKDAIALLREKRSPVVLANQTFHNYLLGLDEQPV